MIRGAQRGGTWLELRRAGEGSVRGSVGKSKKPDDVILVVRALFLRTIIAALKESE